MGPETVWPVAVHEAAHGLLYRVHGGRVKALAILPVPTADGTAASCTGVCGPDIRATGGLRRLLHDAMVHVAGVEGERVVCTDVDERHASRDLHCFEATLRTIIATGADGTLRDVWDRTIRRLVTHVLRRHQGILLEVATALTEARRLDEPRAMAVFAQAERRWGLQPGPLAGEAWPAAFAQALEAIRPIGQPPMCLFSPMVFNS
jgi:hypothetical protein